MAMADLDKLGVTCHVILARSMRCHITLQDPITKQVSDTSSLCPAMHAALDRCSKTNTVLAPAFV